MTTELATPAMASAGDLHSTSDLHPARHAGEPLLLEPLRWGLALVLVSSGVEKLAQPLAFYESLLGYRLWGADQALALATAVPWAEVVIGSGLVLPGLRVGAALLTVALGIAFVVVHGWMWRSGLEVDCGCGGLTAAIGTGTTGAGAFALAAGFLLGSLLCLGGLIRCRRVDRV